MVPEDSLIPHDLTGIGMHRHDHPVVFWIFHTWCKGTPLSQLSASAAHRYVHALLHPHDHAYLHEYSRHDTHQHPDGGTDAHPNTESHKSAYMDFAANIYHSNHHPY